MEDNKHLKRTDVDKQPLSKRDWLEFRKSGLLFIVNQFLHIFGWCIVFQYLDETKDPEDMEPTNVFVARTTFRGFGEEAQDRGYKAVTKYMVDNATKLLKDCE